MVQVSIVNVVGHLDFQRELELSSVAELLQGNRYVTKVKYRPEENHWLQTWFESPITNEDRYVSFYRSGAAMATGCTSVEEFKELAYRIESVMGPVVEKEVLREVKNIVATGNVDTTFNLSPLAILLGLDSVEYEPEQFPGLMYRDSKRRCVFLVFASGKIVCTGLNNIEETQKALQGFTEELLNNL